jgi:hypothetical protein
MCLVSPVSDGNQLVVAISGLPVASAVIFLSPMSQSLSPMSQSPLLLHPARCYGLGGNRHRCETCGFLVDVRSWFALLVRFMHATAAAGLVAYRQDRLCCKRYKVMLVPAAPHLSYNRGELARWWLSISLVAASEACQR